jgi:hypothetical protein
MGIGVGAVVAPRVAPARELVVGAETNAQYDSNIFSTEDAEDDVIFRIGPRFELRDGRGDLTYSLRYNFSYDFYKQFNQLDDFEHFVQARLGWRIAPTTQLTFSDTFFDTGNARRAAELVGSSPDVVDTVPVTVIGSDRLQTNTASIDLVHYFTPRLSGEVTGTYSLLRSELIDRSDTDVYTGQGSLLYSVGRNDRIGAGYGATFQRILPPDIDVGGADDLSNRDTWFHNVFGVWEHQFSPTWNLRAQAGPTLVQPDELESGPDNAIVSRYPFLSIIGPSGQPLTGLLDANSCQTFDGIQVAIPTLTNFGCRFLFPPVEASSKALADELRNNFIFFPIQDEIDQEGSSITYFADVSLTKEWETVTGTLSYGRSAGTSSGIGASTTTDSVRGTAIWRPTRNWTVQTIALFDRQESIGRTTVTGIQVLDAATAFVTLPSTQVDADLLLQAFLTQPNLATAARSIGVVRTDIKSKLVTNRFLVSLYADRKLGRNLSIFGRTSYTYQKNTRSGFFDSVTDYHSYRFELGVRYEFDPIQL